MFEWIRSFSKLLAAFDKKSQVVILITLFANGVQFQYFTSEVVQCNNKIKELENSKQNIELEFKKKIQDCHDAVVFEIKNCNTELVKLINEVNAIKNKLKNDK